MFLDDTEKIFFLWSSDLLDKTLLYRYFEIAFSNLKIKNPYYKNLLCLISYNNENLFSCVTYFKWIENKINALTKYFVLWFIQIKENVDTYISVSDRCD